MRRALFLLAAVPVLGSSRLPPTARPDPGAAACEAATAFAEEEIATYKGKLVFSASSAGMGIPEGYAPGTFERIEWYRPGTAKKLSPPPVDLLVTLHKNESQSAISGCPALLAMLDAGKHVLVEKPLATSVPEAQAMVAAADRAGVSLMVDFHARWHPLYMGAKGYVERGELGRPVMAYARLSDTIHVPTRMLAWGRQSGPEWFLFPHTMDLVRWLFAREPVEALALWRGVASAHPGVAQYQINLTKLLVALGRYDEAQSRIDALRGLGRFGQHQIDARQLQKRLEAAKRADAVD